MAPTLSQVQAWNVSALTDMATLFSTDNDENFMSQIDGAKKFFTDTSTWRGAANSISTT